MDVAHTANGRRYTDAASATSPLPLTAPWQAHGCALRAPGFGGPSSDPPSAAGLECRQPRRVVQLRPRTPCINAHCRVVQVQVQVQDGTAQHTPGRRARWSPGQRGGEGFVWRARVFILAAAANFHKQAPQPACGDTWPAALSAQHHDPPSTMHSSVCVCVCPSAPRQHAWPDIFLSLRYQAVHVRPCMPLVSNVLGATTTPRTSTRTWGGTRCIRLQPRLPRCSQRPRDNALHSSQWPGNPRPAPRCSPASMT